MKVEWILLAAGQSKRFGENKLLFLLDGKPLYRHIFDRLLEITAQRQERLTVVISNETLKQEIQKTAAQAVWNPAPALGQSASIQCALRSVGLNDNTAYIFFVADQPWMPKEEIFAFLEGFFGSQKEMGCMFFGSRRGNPGIFTGESAKALLNLEGDVGGSVVLKSNPQKVYAHICKEEKYLYDIDKWDDLRPEKK